jgi:hypothetical protein
MPETLAQTRLAPAQKDPEFPPKPPGKKTPEPPAEDGDRADGPIG